MRYDKENKLDKIINELSLFLEKDFSSRFRYLSEKEDRQLFFLAKILTRLKQLSGEPKKDNLNKSVKPSQGEKTENKILIFPSYKT
ncbi:MAG: hypothetical protein A3B68_00485 [Candidatus Melainabacteria bacterium RIFCSPHIGHO2_02_FULL_34_12]|nr:MAG: hypothetical protein A3B68_00485 [Candidatus Melainabacteria bacterium RIFCSPHIGHO2_02_FULL_34_12]